MSFRPRNERARAVTGRQCLHSALQWGLGRLFGALPVFFLENNRNSETESQKIDPKVPNVFPRATKGPLTKFGVHGKKTDFCAQIRVFRPKKTGHFLVLTMFWPQPGKVVQTKKYPFPKYISVY